MHKQCPTCGKIDEDDSFQGSFCPGCADYFNPPKRREVKPVEVCVRCKCHRVGREWFGGEVFGETVKKICPECSLKSGGYHEAVIQVRGPHDRARTVANKLSSIIGRSTHVVAFKEDKHGFDIQVLRKRPAIEAVQSLKYEHEKTNKLVTQRRDGKRLYRMTLCIRLPE
jgi:NMD protein affecting ribosome stability and mRNA decay